MSKKTEVSSNSIPSPYNFVPLSNIIVNPDWADKVTHDVPFEDGMSGELALEMEAMSPVYVRNSEGTNDTDFFSAVFTGEDKEKYMIPGSSIKGVFRNVLEIASFGKLSRISNRRYSIRDLYYRPYTEKLTARHGGHIVPLAKSGWLFEEGEHWYIIPCSYARVEQEEIRRISREFPTTRGSSVGKYKKYRGKLNVLFELSSDLVHLHKDKELKIEYKKVKRLGQGDQKGTLVFTGQPNDASKKGSKHMEFVFYNKQEGKIIPINDNIKEDFEFIHTDPVSGKPNEEWEYWRRKLHGEVDRVPVFYLTRDAEAEVSEENPPESMGLAMMYRLPYNLSVGDAVRNTNKEHFPGKKEPYKPDLADLIFGYVHGDKALKGRVQIGHFRETKESEIARKAIERRNVRTVLGSPRPTYYPNYIKQNAKNGELSGDYKTYMDKDAKIRGWKRYPVRSIEDQPLPEVPGDNPNIAVTFSPLPKGCVFEGKIRFHNLKPEELGALLWVITLGGNGNRHHQVGMAKPLGFGRVKFKPNMDVSRVVYPTKSPVPRREVEDSFKRFMEKSVEGGWANSVQIKSLEKMADSGFQDENIDLHYHMTPKEFMEDKKHRKVLMDYSLSGRSTSSSIAKEKNSAGSNPAKKIESNKAIANKDHSISSSVVVKLINCASSDSPKNIRKKLNSIENITTSEYDRLVSVLKKRNDWSRREFLKGGFDWPEALEKLKSRVADK